MYIYIYFSSLIFACRLQNEIDLHSFLILTLIQPQVEWNNTVFNNWYKNTFLFSFSKRELCWSIWTLNFNCLIWATIVATYPL